MCVHVLKKKSVPNPFVNEKGIAGRAWVEGLSRPNPMIASRKVRNLSTGRAQKLECFIVISHFSKLKTTLEKLGLMGKPELIYSIDDKGCKSYLHKQPLLLIKKESGKRIKLIAA